jgi:predicted transcriptional regulator
VTEAKRLDLLFFELASESRLDILRELCGSNLKMQDLARKLDLTATEASRQLQRMSKSKLIERLPNGKYKTTEYGKLLLSLSVSMKFVFKNSDYFLEHDVWQIPMSFVHRLGELSNSVLISDLPENMLRWEKIVANAEEHLWATTPTPMAHLSRIAGEKLIMGVKVRAIFSDKVREVDVDLPLGKGAERKTLPTIPVIILAAERDASISFPRLNGAFDHPTFFGDDPDFIKKLSFFNLDNKD